MSVDIIRDKLPLRPRKPWGSLERTAQDGHLDSHTSTELRDEQCYDRAFEPKAYQCQKHIILCVHNCNYVHIIGYNVEIITIMCSAHTS